MVVAALPVVCHASDFGKGGKDVALEHFGADGAVEAFDVSILGRPWRRVAVPNMDLPRCDARNQATTG